ncbi:MAG: ferrous iron transport protein A [Deltaproteobacteria bacterium]|nr:ferrous iron transport protein A [Deltaproteobacteria bacterium]
MVKKYRITFLGLQQDLDEFRERMFDLGFAPGAVERIVQNAPVVLRKDMTLGDARQVADAIQVAGGKVSIQDDGLSEEPVRIGPSMDVKPFEYFTMCPECGHKQPRSQVCVRCGRPLQIDAAGWKEANDGRR